MINPALQLLHRAIVESSWRIKSTQSWWLPVVFWVFLRLVLFEELEFGIGLDEYVVWEHKLQKVPKQYRIQQQSEPQIRDGIWGGQQYRHERTSHNKSVMRERQDGLPKYLSYFKRFFDWEWRGFSGCVLHELRWSSNLHRRIRLAHFLRLGERLLSERYQNVDDGDEVQAQIVYNTQSIATLETCIQQVKVEIE